MGVTMGITQASLETELPILFGVLTCNREQAYVRSEGDRNKGYHTFKAAIDMIDYMRGDRANVRKPFALNSYICFIGC